MTQVLKPAIWLIVLIAGLPQLSETVYTPSLPDISNALDVSEPMVEYTLTIYLFGLAVGTLFWGMLSDKTGRKPCILAGLSIFIIGCISCYLSDSIQALLASRFIQAFGGSVGTVLGQAVCRDAFQGAALGKAYSAISSALALFPAIGPVIGGLIAESFEWNSIFLFLVSFTVLLSILISKSLPETHTRHNRHLLSKIEVALSLLKNKKVIGFGIIVAACNGLSFSYYAEGSFYLIDTLGLSPTQYGLSFIAIAISTMLGGIVSKKLNGLKSSHTIMRYGLTIILIATSAFYSLILLHTYINPMPKLALSLITVIAQMGVMFGVCITTSNALALALTDYKWCIGTASSLFGFFYYSVISLFTFGMGLLHDGTLLAMPQYFLGISILMLLVRRLCL